MKKSIAFLGIILFLGGMFAAAGPVNGKKFEFGTALSFFSFNQDDSPDDLISFLNIPVRFGWFFWKGFEIEPEIILTIPTYRQGGGVSYLAMGHLTYNFSASEKLAPFVGFGAGFGNGVPYFGTILGDSGIKAWALDGIAGVRYLIVKSAALRAEYRFSRYFYDASWTLETRKATHHQFFVGLSIFFQVRTAGHLSPLQGRGAALRLFSFGMPEGPRHIPAINGTIRESLARIDKHLGPAKR